MNYHYWIMKKNPYDVESYIVYTLRSALELKEQGYEPTETCGCDRCKILMGETEGMNLGDIRYVIDRDVNTALSNY